MPPLEPRGGVDHVADHALALVPVGGDHRLAGVDPDPDAEGQLPGRLQDGQPAADGPFRVVLVGRGGAEHGHHPVADELVQGAPEPLDLPAEPGMVGAEQRPDVLGVGLVGAGGEADQITEEHRDNLALLGRRVAR